MTRTPAPRRISGRLSLPSAYARVAAALALVGGMVAGSAAGCGSDGIVGGDCAAGYVQCGLSCFDLQTDPANCGACGNACPPGVACVAGSCGGVPLDATALDDGAPWNDADYIPDGEVCDVSDPAHPVCHPRPHPDASHPDGGDDGSAEAGGDGSGGDGSDDGNGGDGTLGGDGSGGGGDGSGGDGSGGGGDGSGGDGAGGDASYPDGCAPPFDTPQSCGTCGNVCVTPNDVCELVDGGFQCAPSCAPPLVACKGGCVNLARDPKNCGACGTVCPSQYCFLATCQGSVAGNVIVIGHDFQKTLSTDEEALLLTNSVFYNPGAVNLLSFEHYAGAATVANGLSILTKYAAAQHITLNVQSSADDTIVTNDTLLASVSVVFLWDQPNAPPGTLGALGTSWAPHLSKFEQGGGIVIALDAAQGVGEMPALITNAALLTVTGHGTVTPGSPADVPLAGLSIARGMTSVYAVEQNTAWFTTSEASGAKTLYVANVQGQPTELVALQKVIN